MKSFFRRVFFFTSLIVLVNSCSLLSDKESLEDAYPNAVNDNGNAEGKWLWYVASVEGEVQYLFPATLDPTSMSPYKVICFVGLEMENGKVAPFSKARIYSLDSVLIYDGNIVEYQEVGRWDDPFCYSMSTLEGSELIQYRLIGIVNRYNRDGEIIDSIDLEAGYINAEAVDLVLNFISVAKDDPNGSNYFSSRELDLLDSFQVNYNVLLRNKNDQLIDDALDVMVRIDKQIAAENRRQSSANEEYLGTTSSDDVDDSVSEDSHLNATCRRCSRKFYKGGGPLGAMMSFLEGRTYKPGTGWVMIINRGYCEGVKQDPGMGEFCSEHCALEFCRLQ